MGVEQIHQPVQAEIDYLQFRLYEFNVTATGIADGRLLMFVVRDDDTITAGLYGYTWGRSGWIDTLWVSEGLRSSGVGSELLAAAEAEAAARDCGWMALHTHTFQARGFYERHGYEVVGFIDNHPPPHGQYLMQKSLTKDGLS